MKRLLTVAVFALLACAGMATPTLAGSFGLFYGGRHGYDGAVSIRPYNAFSPVLYGDVPGYNGSNGDGGYGQGAYGPIAYRHGCGNNCGQGGYGQGGCGYGQGGCGQGGCGQGGYGYGQGNQGGYDYRLRMMNLRGPNDTGALGYAPPDGYGNGAFGNYGLGRLSVFGMPVDGGCLSCPKNYWTLNPQQAPMTCGPNGCAPSFAAPQGQSPQWGGSPLTYPAQPNGPIMSSPTPLPTPAIPGEIKSQLLPVPNVPKAKELPQAFGTTMQGSSMPGGVPTQPVSYAPGYNYNMPAQQMMPYGYMPNWGYGYYGYPMNYPTWGYQGR